MLSFPSRLTRSGLAIIAVLALSTQAALAQSPSKAAPARTGPIAPRAVAHTTRTGVMAPVHYTVFFWRVSGSRHGAGPWWAPERPLWRT